MVTTRIEIEAHSIEKWEFDKKINAFVLDRLVSQAYPFPYGYVPNTLSGDGDPLDVFIITNRALKRGEYVNIIPLGVLIVDDNGSSDEKLIGVIIGDNNIVDESVDVVKITNFLRSYKAGIIVDSYKSLTEAVKIIHESRARANE